MELNSRLFEFLRKKILYLLLSLNQRVPGVSGKHFTKTWGWPVELSVTLRRRQPHPTPVLLPGKSHGQRSLVGCSPWGRWESDTTEGFPFHFPLSCIGEGNGSPLQYSCLENPRDGGAWWAAIYGVAQSRTWLTWLSSWGSIAKKPRERNQVPGMSSDLLDYSPVTPCRSDYFSMC